MQRARKEAWTIPRGAVPALLDNSAWPLGITRAGDSHANNGPTTVICWAIFPLSNPGQASENHTGEEKAVW